MDDLRRMRNIGISAHIDSGKTTLTERILYYTGRTHRIGDVGDEGAVMDFMDLERERGITITAAATRVGWRDWTVNLIDTPGHVDFTVEVERSLRVLDGAVLVLCAVAGVQSQTITVDRQMKRYHVPRIAFVNKMDRPGADPQKVLHALENRLGLVAVPLQIPIGTGPDFTGVVDLITRRALYFEGPCGEHVREQPLPADLVESTERARAGMLDTLSLYSDELMEAVLETGDAPEDLIRRVIRQATLAEEITPVLLGSAYRNRGVQPLLDAIGHYLPAPLDCEKFARDHTMDGAEVPLACDPDAPLVAIAFKLVAETYGQLTYTRIYQGRLRRGDVVWNPRTGRKVRVGRLLRMHANHREDIDEAAAGDIVAIVGADCASGDTLAAAGLNLSLEPIHVPEPVISLAVRPVRNADRDRLSKALQRFSREDPTFHVRVDAESGETIISGMGELQLEVYVERIRREYGCEVEVGAPRVAYRECPTTEVAFNHRYRKQTGGAGHYAHVIGRLVPLPVDGEHPDYLFESSITQGRIPSEFIPSVDKGFQMARMNGPLAGFEIIGVRMVLEDGSYHPVDSSDLAFQICARDAFREAFLNSRPALLEPIMRVEIECPSNCQGSVVADLATRRGLVTGCQPRGQDVVITAEVPLATMFGYSTDLRSLTQGRATFSMEFARYQRVPADRQQQIVEQARASSGSARR